MVIINGGSDVLPTVDPPPPDPAPEQPTDPEQWPWPFNLLQNFLQGAFAWISDSVKYWVDDLGGDVTDFFQNIDVGLTNLGDWLKSQIDNGIKDSQSFLGKVITDTQKTTDTLISGTQTFLDTSIKGIQKGLDDWGTAQTTAIRESGGTISKDIEVNRSLTDEQIKGIRGERAVNLTDLIDEIPKAIFTFINASIGPVLKGLNDVLEEI